MIHIPETRDEITADWLSSILQLGNTIECHVVAVERTPIGEGIGMLSSMLRCRLFYDDPKGGEPTSLVVKLPPESQVARQSLNLSHGFEREILFYREVAARAPIRVPSFIYGDYDDHQAVIVLEDLGNLVARNQIHGLNNAEIIAAAREIARLHAHFWNEDRAENLDWVPIHDDQVTKRFYEHWDRFVDVYGLRVGKEAIALGNRLRSSLEWLHSEFQRRPRTICHGDFRADNLFFDKSGELDEVVVVDWQLCTRSLGALDVARLLGGSEPSNERSGHHGEVLALWHETMVRAGVSDYSLKEAYQDFSLGALMNLCLPVHVLSKWGPDAEGRKGQLLDAIATRIFAFALEIDAADRLP